MACVGHMDTYRRVQGQRVAPVRFMDEAVGKTPAPEMRANAKPAENIPDFWLEPHNGGVVQMIPVVMRNQQAVDIRHVMNGVRGGSGKGLCAEGYRRGIGAEYRVDEQAAASKLNKKRGMAQPQNCILPALQCVKGDMF